LIEKTQRSLSGYHERLSQPNLYAAYEHRYTPISSTILRMETNMDDVHRSKSVLDHNSQRPSRKDGGGEPESAEQQHSRSKSADYLLDRRSRDDILAPENELQKSVTDSYYPPERREQQHTEYTERFRKSVEKLHVPDWYREYGTDRSPAPFLTTTASGLYDPAPLTTTTTTSGVFSGVGPASSGTYEQRSTTTTRQHQQPWSYTATPNEPLPDRLRSPSSPPIGGISFPPGMFDKYKDEIEDLRRSRTSLHQIATTPQEHIKVFAL
jgi:hypothetical protein